MDTFLEREKNVHEQRTFYKNFKDFPKIYGSGNIIEIYSYFIPLTDIYYFHCDDILKDFFIREGNFLFLVHPLNLTYYSSFFCKYREGPKFKGLVTSSARTIYIKDSSIEFFVKLSLDLLEKNISQSEVSRSIGTTMVLDKLNKEGKLPENFKFFRETLSCIPKMLERGGMIIREIHPDFKKNIQIYPVFSLFYNDKELLKNIFNKVLEKYPKRSFKDFVRSFMLYPFIEQFVKLKTLNISTQPHSQNLMFSLSEDGTEIKDFYHKDFGGFTLKLDEDTKKYLPYIQDLNKEYYQNDINANFQYTLCYFNFGILYEMMSDDSKMVIDESFLKEALDFYEEKNSLFNMLVNLLNDFVAKIY